MYEMKQRSVDPLSQTRSVDRQKTNEMPNCMLKLDLNVLGPYEYHRSILLKNYVKRYQRFGFTLL